MLLNGYRKLSDFSCKGNTGDHAHILTLLICFVLLFCGCDGFRLKNDPLLGPFPYLFKKVKNFPANGLLLDLDHDGREELLTINPVRVRDTSPYIEIRNSNFEFIEQVNLNGGLSGHGAA